jgi:excisionase family DNA binding protein
VNIRAKPTADLAAARQPQPLAVDYHEAGRLCGLHAETIARLCRRGELPHVRIGRARRVMVADLEAFLRRSRAEEGRA